MAATSTDLYDLIRTMSTAEKSHFKKYGLKRGGDSTQYFKLFDAIDRQKEYDEDRISKRFDFKSFATAKNHLYKMVLRAVMDFNNGKTKEDQILQHTRESVLLQQRGLDSQSLKRIRSAQSLIEAEDLPWYHIPLSITELSLIPFTEDAFDKKLEVLDREKKVVEIVSGYSDYRRIYTEMTNLVARFGVIVREPAHVKELDDFLAQPLLQDDSSATYFTAKYMFLSVHKILNQCLCRYETALEYAQETVALFEQFPEYKVRKPQYLTMAMNNVLIDLVGLGRIEEFDQVASDLEAFNTTLPEGYYTEEGIGNLQVKRLYRDLIACDFKQAYDRTTEMTEKRFDFPYQPHMVVQQEYLMASACFYYGKFEEAQQWTLGLISRPEISSYREYQLFALILNLILHLEAGNRERLQQARDSAYRFLSRTNRLYELEKLLLSFLKSYERIPDDNEELRQAYQKLRARLEPLTKDSFERNAFSYFHFLPWLDSKIDGLSLPEAAQKRLATGNH